MPWEEVTPDPAGDAGSFFKFKSAGDKLIGLYVGTEPGNFGEEYIFQIPDGRQLRLTPPKVLRSLLEKAITTGLVPGHNVAMLMTGTKPSGYANPTGLFTLKVDKSKIVPVTRARSEPPADAFRDEVDVPF